MSNFTAVFHNSFFFLLSKQNLTDLRLLNDDVILFLLLCHNLCVLGCKGADVSSSCNSGEAPAGQTGHCKAQDAETGRSARKGVGSFVFAFVWLIIYVVYCEIIHHSVFYERLCFFFFNGRQSHCLSELTKALYFVLDKFNQGQS